MGYIAIAACVLILALYAYDLSRKDVPPREIRRRVLKVALILAVPVVLYIAVAMWVAYNWPHM